MSAKADAIIVGNLVEGDTVSVSKWLKTPSPDVADLIVIKHLGKHSKTIYNFLPIRDGEPANTLPTRRLIAFLENREGAWESLGTVEDSGLCGSCGVMWIQDNRCYRYLQLSNPGPYGLAEAEDLKTEAALMAAIAEGLRDAAAWDAAFSLTDPALRAQRLAAYTLASTSPASQHRTFRHRAREPLREMGSAAVPALRSQITDWREGDSLDEVVLILYDLGQVARSAVPDLLLLLKHPEQANPYYVISALRTTGDLASISHIKPFLDHSNEQVRKEAANAIQVLSK